MNEELKKQVYSLEALYKAKRSDLPQPERIEHNLYEVAGLDGLKNLGQLEDYHFLYIPVSGPEIQNFGTSCGYTDNKVFEKDSVLNFLKKNGVQNIVGLVSNIHEDALHVNRITLDSVVLPLNEKVGEKFSDLIDKHGGSLRCDTINIDGWTIYESE